MYGIVHPAEQWESDRRRAAVAVLRARAASSAPSSIETAGWERPHWYESNAPLLEEYGDRVTRREAEWESRWWSPIINAEHLAMRDRAAMIDLTAFAIFDVTGPGALDAVQRVAMRQMDVPVGRVVYTPILTPSGGFKQDLTIMRLDDDVFRVVTGGAYGMSDLKWFADHLPGGRLRADPRPDERVVHARAVGPARAGHPRLASRATTSRTRASRSRAAATIEVGPLRGARLADLLRRRPRLGAVRADRAGRAALGHRRRGGRAARDRPRRDRRLRHDRPAREVLPRVRRRARRRLQRRRGRDGVGQGQGPGLHRQGGARPPPRGGAGARSCAR